MSEVSLSYLAIVGLTFVAALFYIAVTVILKYWQALPPAVAGAAVLVFFVLACVVEIEVLRRATVAEVVVLIIAFEVVIACAVSRFWLGELLSARVVIGMAFVVLGVVILVWNAPAASAGAFVGQRGAAD